MDIVVLLWTVAITAAALAIWIWGVLIVRNHAKDAGYRHNLWTALVATTVNFGLLCYLGWHTIHQRRVGESS